MRWLKFGNIDNNSGTSVKNMLKYKGTNYQFVKSTSRKMWKKKWRWIRIAINL